MLDGWTTELLPNPTSSDRFSACRVLNFSFQCCALCCAKPAQLHLCSPLAAHLPVLQSKLPCCICNLWVSYSQTLQIWYTKLANQTFRTKSCRVWKSCVEAVLEPVEKRLPWARSLLPAGCFKPRPKWCLVLRKHIGNSKQLPDAGVHKIQDSLSRDLWISSTSW